MTFQVAGHPKGANPSCSSFYVLGISYYQGLFIGGLLILNSARLELLVKYFT